MDWKEFFKLVIYQETKKGLTPFFKAELSVPDQFPVHELIMGQFEHWNLSENEKRRLSIGIRKILLCHDHFQTQSFKSIVSEFEKKLALNKSSEINLVTHGGGIYLFLALMKSSPKLSMNKTIMCHTSELPLPIMKVPPSCNLKLVYRPNTKSYFADFPSLWQESELLSLFDKRERKLKLA